ncbi:MAG: hypothetical protein JJT75_14240 [Opitutales bacterium]|nr:hypothetical protein [Opitutales bacterium]
MNSGFTVLAPIDFTSVTLRYAASSANDGEYYLNVIQTETTQFSGDTTTFAKTGDWANWDEVTIELSGSVGDYLNFAFANTTNDGGVNVDSIEFTPIPELSTSALIMGLGAVCIMFLKRRRFYAGKLKI